MSCVDCEARQRLLRDSLIQGKIQEALSHAAKGALEAVGVKQKSGASEELAETNSGALPGNSPY